MQHCLTVSVCVCEYYLSELKNEMFTSHGSWNTPTKDYEILNLKNKK